MIIITIITITIIIDTWNDLTVANRTISINNTRNH